MSDITTTTTVQGPTSTKMSTNRPFLANFLAAFRAQSAFKASSAGGSQSSSQITNGARAIATKATNASSSASTPSTPSTPSSSMPLSTSPGTSASSSTNNTASQQSHQHHHHHRSSHHTRHHHPASTRPQSHNRAPHTTTETASSSSPSPSSPSGPIPITYSNDHYRQRRGSDSSSGSGGFRDALGPEKWYIGGRTATGEECFYRLGMVTKAGGRLGASGRVGSVDQLSL